MTTVNLSHTLRRAWSAETSVDENWSPANPALGQCAVTALVVQDVLGGELVRGAYDGGSHYWNRLPSGTEVDLTAEQFNPLPVFSDVEVRERSYVLSFAATRARYELLRDRLERANCPHAGQAGHSGCGVCEHGKPVFTCEDCFPKTASGLPVRRVSS